MARKEIPSGIDLQPMPETTEAFDDGVKALGMLALEEATTNDNARAVAMQLGYQGTLTVGTLEDEIRFYQKRTIEDCLELGKRLLLLKELSLHGEFKKRLELLDINTTTAHRFMSATLKFSKVATSQLLNAAKSQSKLLELLVLDDGEVEAIESGESIRGVTLDEIERMSVSELRKALRESKETIKAKDGVIQDKNRTIDEKIEEITKNRLKTERMAKTDWPKAYKSYFLQVNEAKDLFKKAIYSLEMIRKDAMEPDAENPEDDAELSKAREILAAEMVSAHNDCAELLGNIGLQFDRTLGAFTEARINLLTQ